ncbi:hypothetical protein AAMO2058_000558600 [Amorphochlora amoebiformis]
MQDEGKLLTMVANSLRIQSFTGEPKDLKGPEGRQWGRCWSWFDSLSAQEHLKVLEINEPQWADMLLRMHQQEVKVGSPGVYIFNMTGAKARVGGLGMDNVADYPTSRTPFRFVTWKFIREKLESPDPEALSVAAKRRLKRYNGNPCGNRLVAGLRLLPLQLPENASETSAEALVVRDFNMETSYNASDVKWNVGFEAKLSSKKGALRKILEDADRECCTREFYLEVTKRSRERPEPLQRRKSILPSSLGDIDISGSVVASGELQVNSRTPLPASGKVACLQHARFITFSLGSFIAKKLSERVKQAYQRWGRTRVAHTPLDHERRQAQAFFTSLPRHKQKSLILKPNYKEKKAPKDCNQALQRGQNGVEKVSRAVLDGFRVRMADVGDVWVARRVLELRQEILKHQAEIALRSLEVEESTLPPPDRISKKRSRKRKSKRRSSRGKMGRASMTKESAENNANTHELTNGKEGRHEERGLEAGESQSGSPGRKSERKTPRAGISKRKKKQICRQIVELICKKVCTRIARNIKKQNYKKASRSRFAQSIIQRCINNALESSERRTNSRARALARGSPAYQELRRTILGERKEKREKTWADFKGISSIQNTTSSGLLGTHNDFKAPAEELNFSDFVLTPLCVNGRRGMRQLAPNQSYAGCWWWGGHFRTLELLSTHPTANRKFEPNTQRIVTMHCRFGEDCQRSDCPHPHRNPTPISKPVSLRRNLDPNPDAERSSGLGKMELSGKGGFPRPGLPPSTIRLIASFLPNQTGRSYSAVSKLWKTALLALPIHPGQLRPIPTDPNSHDDKKTGSSDLSVRVDLAGVTRGGVTGRKVGGFGVPSKALRLMREHSMRKCLSYYLSLFKNVGGEVSLFTALSADVREMAGSIEDIAKHKRPAEIATIDALRRALKELWPGARADIYGSFDTGLNIPTSDIDIVICNTEAVPKDIHNAQRTRVQRLATHLSNQKWVKSVHMIAQASVPLVKVHAKVGITTINLDLSFDSSLHRGLPTCAYVRALCIEYPSLLPLSLVLKQFLARKQINNPYTGGLSSYGLVLMIASILKRDAMFKEHLIQSITHADIKIDSSGSNHVSSDDEDLLSYVQRGFFSEEAQLGRLLVTFFDTFGRRFDTRLHAVSISNSEDAPDYAFCGAKHRHRFPGHTLVLVDPFNASNNIGRTCFNIWQIQQVFSTALNNITTAFADTQGAIYVNPTALLPPDKRKDTYESGPRYPPPLPPKRSILGASFGTAHHNHILSSYRNTWIGKESTKAKSLRDMKERAGVKVVGVEIGAVSRSRLVECSRAMQRKRALALARIEELEKQIEKRREINDQMIQKAESRSLAVGKLAREGKGRGVELLMSNVEDLTSYLAWINDQRRANIAEIEHLRTKIDGVKTEFYQDMKVLALRMGRAPFSLDEVQNAIRLPTKNQKVKKLVDRKTEICRWRIQQLEEDIEEMEQMKVALEACAEYQVAQIAMQKLKASTDPKSDGTPGETSSHRVSPARSPDSKSIISTPAFDGKKFHKESMHLHALDWCPKVPPNPKPTSRREGSTKGRADDEVRAGISFLAWLNQQNRANHAQISQLRLWGYFERRENV